MSGVAQKLGIKPASRVAVDGQPVGAVQPLLGDLPEGVVVSARGGALADHMILAAESLAQLAELLEGAWDQLAPAGRLWVWYRKGASKSPVSGAVDPLQRDTLQALLAARSMDGVTLISVDSVWSAMRVRQR